MKKIHFKYKYLSFDIDSIFNKSSSTWFKPTDNWFCITNWLFLLSCIFFNLFANCLLSFIIMLLIFWFFLFSSCKSFIFFSIFLLSNIWFFNSLFSLITLSNFIFNSSLAILNESPNSLCNFVTSFVFIIIFLFVFIILLFFFIFFNFCIINL